MNDSTEISVGVLHSLTGTMSNDEKHLVDAAIMAIDEINQNGGVLGRQIKAVVKNGASDPAVFAVQAEKLLKEEKVEAIFGCWTSVARKAVKPIVEKYNSLLWYPVQYEGLEQSPNIIYTGSCLNQQIEPAVNWALSTGRQKSFLLGSDYVFPRTANSLTRTLIKQGGGQVVGEQYVSLGSDDFEEAVRAIKTLRPEIVYNTINGDGNLSFFRRFAEEKIDVNECIIMSFSLSEIELQDVGEETSGHYACCSYFQTHQSPENEQFLDNYKQRFGEHSVVSDPIVTAYTQVYLWKEIVDSAGSCDSKEILGCAAGKHVVGPCGLFKLQANNHIIKPAFIGKATQSGQFDIVWSSDSLIDPKPWLGIEDTELKTRNLIKDALAQYPEIIHLNLMLDERVQTRTNELEESNRILNHEITERKQAEETAREKTAFIANVINSLSHPFYVIGASDYTIKMANAAARQIGITEESFCYTSTHNRNAPCDSKEHQCPLAEVIKSKKAVIVEHIHYDDNGDPRNIEVHGYPLFDNNGNVVQVIEYSRDITDSKKLEDTLRQSQKMESVGTLAGGVAHEFNNVLGGILGYTEIAIDDAREDSPVRESLDEILKLSNRAKDVVKQILSFSREGNKEFKPILPHLTIEESIKVLRATIPTTIDIKHNIDKNSGTVLADPTQINQVGTNLCMNAAHAMEDSGGVLEIGLSPVILDAEDVKPYPDLKTGEYVKLTVNDTGSGIDPKNIVKIFDPFFTTKGVGKGTGMGLSITHGIIKDHGGVITVSSKLGEGTTFTVFLPKVESKSKETKIEDAIPTGAENILVVDDEEHMVFLTKTILGRLGYQVTALTSSLDALELFKKDSQRYDLIITDLTMPHLTGDRLASEVTSIRPDMPVILATGYADALESEKVKQSGFKAFIPKPYQKRELAKTIRLILDEK